MRSAHPAFGTYRKLKEDVEKAENKEEAKKMIKEAGVEAGMELSEEELDQVAGGWSWPWK